MNLHQIPQWEKVAEKNWDQTSKIASMKGNYLRMPVYRIKQEEGDEKQGRKSVGNLDATR